MSRPAPVALCSPPARASARRTSGCSALPAATINDIEKHEHDVRRIVLPPPCPLAIAPTGFAHAELLIQRGNADACEFLDGGGADRPPIRMHVYRHNTPAFRKFGSRIAA
jgi:hypothetical protein